MSAMEHFAAYWGAATPGDAVRRACRTLLEETGQFEAPVALAPIWRRLGVQVAYDERDADGSLHAVGDHFVVRVRRDAPRYRARLTTRALPCTWRRSRFSLAHELGHVLLLRGVPAPLRADLTRSDRHSQVERLCNLAAAELLMPQHEFRADAVSAGFTPHGLRHLYDRYLVSWPALMIRLAETFGANVTLWRCGVRRPDGEVMRVTETYGGGAVWLPRELSERYLAQPVVRLGLRDGVTALKDVAVDYSTEPFAAHALAAALPGTRPQQSPLPSWQGAPIPDDRSMRDQVALMLLPPERERDWDDLRRSRPPRSGRGPLPTPFAMVVDAPGQL